MRARHAAGCTCDQVWHHRRSGVAAHVDRRNERERMDAARLVGKTMNNLARERRAWAEEDAAARAVPP
ncbi:hypothetical protein [Virgisporangium aurantiacum]|uniref:Uncharacterized protein n=1 Tax=Virgisporangium aurantiacum TaxID=175570 RepID=A0A8J4E285_9ACTN|nr:hypothetical protein [Virgisporangium aurantiacum]GIJ59545.1 hypothetical protein Vau01_070610 [Virgisporangium aurantiacum]